MRASCHCDRASHFMQADVVDMFAVGGEGPGRTQSLAQKHSFGRAPATSRVEVVSRIDRTVCDESYALFVRAQKDARFLRGR